MSLVAAALFVLWGRGWGRQTNINLWQRLVISTIKIKEILRTPTSTYMEFQPSFFFFTTKISAALKYTVTEVSLNVRQLIYV